MASVRDMANREAASSRQDDKRAGWSWWYLLFLIQFVAVLWPPFYNMAEPDLIGIPFFYADSDEAGHAFQFEAGRVFRSEAGHPWRRSHGSIS